MNWHNLSEKDFDANIKRHVGNSNPPYDPASWEKMNQMLDLIAPNSITGNGRLYELLIVLIVLSSFFFWNVSTFPENSMVDGNGKTVVSGNTSQAAESKLSLTQQATIENHTSNKKSISTSENKGEATPKQNLDDFDKNQASTSTNNAFTAAASTSSATTSTNNNTSTAANTSAAASPISGLDSESDATTVSASDAFTFNGNNNERENPSINNNNQALPTRNESSSYGSSGSTNTQRYYQSMLAAMGPDIVSQQLSPLPSSIKGEVLINSEAPPPVIEKSLSPWLIGAGFAPDISMVGFSATTKPGTNFAAIVEFQLNGRWSIQSGIGFSKKNYQAAGTDYNPPEGFWYYGVIPDNTEATCEVLEIPINARYYFNPTNRNRLFASTGLSSYLMLSEDYYYQYEKYNPHLVKSWSVRNENQHYFGIYNLSAGYQWKVSERWFLEVEPFIKIPLKGVGFGKVDLWSTGSWFAVKYNLH